LLVCAAYFNSLNSEFVSDDTRSVLRNPALDKASYVFGQSKIFLQSILHFFVNRIFGRVPIYYRLVNIFFHIAVVLVTYLFLSILISPRVAFFTAAIFAVHPIEAESVAWISGGPYPQYTFFVMLALLFYLLSYKNKKLFKFSVLAFIVSLYSQDIAVVFPLVIFLFIISFGNLRKEWKRLIPFFVVLFIFLALYIGRVGQRITSFQTNFYQESALVNPLLKIPIAITSYLELIFWPKGLTLYHSEMVFGLTEFIVRAALCVLFLALALYSFRKSRRVFFGLSLFVVSLSPTFTPFNITWVVAERYVYFGSIGIFIVVALLLGRLSENKRLKIFVNILFVLILAALLTRTIFRNIDWKNEDNLYIATAETSPSSPNTYNNLGDVYGRRGDFERAAEEFKKAIAMKPNYADAYHNLANVYQGMGRIDEAIENYKKALQYNPRLWQSYNNLGAIYFNRGDAVLAEESFKKAIEIDPSNPEPQKNLGVVYFLMDEREKARMQLRRALELDPANETARNYLQMLK
jgi:tetratricopeptide (TPR) repeat protein